MDISLDIEMSKQVLMKARIMEKKIGKRFEGTLKE